MKLSPKQISQISQKIGSGKIFYTDIQTEFTDHIACKIEGELKNEEEFENFVRALGLDE